MEMNWKLEKSRISRQEELGNLKVYKGGSEPTIYFNMNENFEIIQAESLPSSTFRIKCVDHFKIWQTWAGLTKKGGKYHLEHGAVKNIFFMEEMKERLMRDLDTSTIKVTSYFDPIFLKNSFIILGSLGIYESLYMIRERSRRIKLLKIESIKQVHQDIKSERLGR